MRTIATGLLLATLIVPASAQQAAQPDKPAAQPDQPSPPSGAGGTPQPGNGPLLDMNFLQGNSARAKKLIGSKVYHGDNAIGEITDILIDLDHATVPAVIISISSGVLNVNSKQIAVPAATIKVGKEARFITEMTEDQFKNAPAFDPSKL